METTMKMTAKEAMSQIAFTTWEHAMKAVKDYIEKMMRELNQDIDDKKDYANQLISEVAKYGIGTDLTVDEFEKYVKVHRELRDTMKDIGHISTKVSREMRGMVRDTMKLIDLKRPRYLKFLKKERVPEDEDTPLTIVMGCLFAVIFIAIYFCFILDFDVYSLGNDLNILNYTNF